jgi:hypothetical protein
MIITSPQLKRLATKSAGFFIHADAKPAPRPPHVKNSSVQKPAFFNICFNVFTEKR